jgi:hypothetical protein
LPHPALPPGCLLQQPPPPAQARLSPLLRAALLPPAPQVPPVAPGGARWCEAAERCPAPGKLLVGWTRALGTWAASTATDGSIKICKSMMQVVTEPHVRAAAQLHTYASCRIACSALQLAEAAHPPGHGWLGEVDEADAAAAVGDRHHLELRQVGAADDVRGVQPCQQAQLEARWLLQEHKSQT